MPSLTQLETQHMFNGYLLQTGGLEFHFVLFMGLSSLLCKLLLDPTIPTGHLQVLLGSM